MLIMKKSNSTKKLDSDQIDTINQIAEQLTDDINTLNNKSITLYHISSYLKLLCVSLVSEMQSKKGFQILEKSSQTQIKNTLKKLNSFISEPKFIDKVINEIKTKLELDPQIEEFIRNDLENRLSSM